MASSEKKLGELHEHVATALTEQVVGYEEETEDGAIRKVRPSPALLGAAIAFLKNNNITADAEGNEKLRELGAALKARREKRVSQSSLDQAADAFATSVGAGNFMQ